MNREAAQETEKKREPEMLTGFVHGGIIGHIGQVDVTLPGSARPVLMG